MIYSDCFQNPIDHIIFLFVRIHIIDHVSVSHTQSHTHMVIHTDSTLLLHPILASGSSPIFFFSLSLLINMSSLVLLCDILSPPHIHPSQGPLQPFQTCLITVIQFIDMHLCMFYTHIVRDIAIIHLTIPFLLCQKKRDQWIGSCAQRPLRYMNLK